MKCPICGAVLDDGMKFCTACGADLAAVSGRKPIKVLYDKKVFAEQEGGETTELLIQENYAAAAGDDGATEQIPENYATAAGDDSATEQIPENYAAAAGDDGVTVQIPENYAAAAGDDTRTVRLEQAQPEAGNLYQTGNMKQPENLHQFQADIKKGPGSYKAFSIVTFILMLGMLVMAVVVAIKPSFYIVQSYVGDMINNNWIDTITERVFSESEQSEIRQLTFMAAVCFAFAAILSLGVVLRSGKTFAKPALGMAVGAFVFAMMAIGVLIILKIPAAAPMKEYRDIFLSQADGMFNVYGAYMICAVVNVVVSLIHICAVASAKSKWKKATGQIY